MSSRLFIGIDIGTSSVRCSAIDENRQLVASSKQDLPLPENPAPGAFEQIPDCWWTATLSSLAQLCEMIPASKVKAISVDGTSSTVLLVDKNNQPVSKALMYNDSRAVKSLEELRQTVPAESITLSASSSLVKAHYLMQQSDRKIAVHIVHQADWVSSHLSGKVAVSDENNCLKLGYDSKVGSWPDWLKKVPLNIYACLPEVFPSGTVIGAVTPLIADQLGFGKDTLIVTGTTDSTASTLATGVKASGEAVTTYGSTLVVKIISDRPVTSVEDGIYSHRLPNGLWLAGGASNSGGNVLLKYFSVDQINQLSLELDTTKSSGLDYYPLSSPGERFPVNNPELMPVLEPRPESDSLFLQAIFEGFARIEKLAYEKMSALGAPIPKAIYTAGGQATENRALREIRCRILGMPVLKADMTEASYGAALIAMQAVS